MIDDGALERLSGLFAEEREEARAAAERKVADLLAGRAVEFAERFGKYGLIRELGRGGLGRVWLAWDPDLKRLVALKTLTAGGQVERLMREARMAARLDHPRIVKVFEVGEAHGVSFIAMQYLDGRSLEDATLPPLEAARVVRDAARLLHWAHERGVLHRDVKPANLMLCGGDVHVVDFGLARPIAGGDSLSAVGGTLAYMSPEQTAGETLGPEADVYSLGATLARLAPARPPALETVIRKAMEPKARRYPTAEAMALDLDRVLRGEAVARRFRMSKFQKAALALALLGSAAVYGGIRRDRHIAARLAAADVAVNAQKFDDAARELDAAERAWGDVGSRRTALVAARLEGAQRLVEKARGLIEESRVNLYKKGAGLSQAFFKDLDAAAESLRRSLALADSAAARLLLGRIALLLGDYEAARREYQGVPGRPAESRLGQARAYVEEAAEELFAGREEQGTFLLASARRLFDEMPGLARRLKEGALESELVEAWRLAAAGEFEAAVAYAGARTSGAEEFFLVLGLAQFRREPGREALRSLTAAIDVRPNYYQAFLWRGLLLARLGSAEYARRDVERALEIHPRYARARAALKELGR